MDIYFSDKKLQKTCADEKRMNRELGPNRAKRLRRRLVQLDAAQSLADIGALPGARCHELTGDRKGQLSLDLDHPHRLIIEPADNPAPKKPDGGLDWSEVTAITVIEIADTH